MKLVLHLAGNDLRRFALLISAWIGLVGIGVVLYAFAPAMAVDRARFSAVGDAMGLLWLARQLLRIVFVVFIVQADPAVGSTAFWMTRPISSRALLAAKALLIFGIGVGVPVAADLALAAVYRVPPADALASAVQTGLANAGWVTAFALLAVLTRSLAQFSIVVGLGITAFAILLSILASTDRVVTAGRPLDPAAFFLALFAVICGLTVAWFVQYARRHRGATLATAAGTVGLGMALLAVGLPAPHRALPEWTNRLTLSPAQAPYPGSVDLGLPGGDRANWSVARAQLLVPELPSGWFARVAVRDATVDLPGASLHWPGRPGFGSSAVGRRPGSLNPEEIAVREALALDTFVNSSTRSWYDGDSAVLFAVREKDAGPYAAGPYRGRLDVALNHVELVGKLPLRQGTVFQDGDHRVTIREIEQNGSVGVLVESTGAAVFMTRRPARQYDLVLVNRRRGQGRRGYSTAIRPRGMFVSFLADAAGSSTGITTGAMMWTFSSDVPWTLDAAWMADAELDVIRTTRVGSVARDLSLPAVPLGPPR